MVNTAATKAPPRIEHMAATFFGQPAEQQQQLHQQQKPHQQQQQSVPSARACDRSGVAIGATTSLQLKSPKDDAGLRMLHRRSSSSNAITTTVRLEDAAASLLHIQSGGVSVSSHRNSGAISAQQHLRVENMPHAEYDGSKNDGIMGLYSGETNEYGRPHGRGQMRYDNGTVFEGKWINGEWY